MPLGQRLQNLQPTRYADWYAAHAKEHAAMPESLPATEQRVRVPALPRQGEDPT